MKPTTSYRYYGNRPEKPSPEFVKSEYEKIWNEIKKAEEELSVDPWLGAFHRWNALKAYLAGEASRANYRLHGQLTNSEFESADKFVREELVPIRQKEDSRIVSAILESRHRRELSERLGEQIFRVFTTQIGPLDPRIADLRIEESKKVAEYRKLMGLGETEFEGKTWTLVALDQLRFSADPEKRRASFFAHRQWFFDHQAEIHALFDDLVKIRQSMAERIGQPNFLTLGYQRMGRTDYGPAEAAQFRKNVRDHMVPLLIKLHAEQANALKTPTLRPWDMDAHPEVTLPDGTVKIEGQLDRAQRVFDRLSPELSAHFSMMREWEAIDLENRPGKGGGAFCTNFPDEPRVAILCNSTGNADDISTLMHEMGHAFQKRESLADGRPIELASPTLDAAEIHSMGMEFLSLRCMDEFLSPEHAVRFKKKRWRELVELMCYASIVDEFQHFLYEVPGATPKERDAEWDRLCDLYQPSIDFTGIESMRPLRWLKQGHIFGSPFYYIDYVIAETAAAQLALLDEKHPKQAMETYLELCRIGGKMSVLQIFKAAGLENPFSPDLMSRIAKKAEAEIFGG